MTLRTATYDDTTHAIVPISADEVLVALKRPEGYEDVHPDLVADDAIGNRWKYRVVAAAPEHQSDDVGDGERWRYARANNLILAPTGAIDAAIAAEKAAKCTGE